MIFLDSNNSKETIVIMVVITVTTVLVIVIVVFVRWRSIILRRLRSTTSYASQGQKKSFNDLARCQPLTHSTIHQETWRPKSLLVEDTCEVT